ncbi:MAG TPA: rRNA maturation RNase YbeY [Clostridiales bacterium]|nr:rRNA maturation RNase YbeY [Clostridiales bacterium]
MKRNSIKADNFTTSKISLRSVINSVEFFTKMNKIKISSLNISFVRDNEMTNINEKYLSHEGSTDVITFDYTEGTLTGIDGEIIICTDEAKRQSKIFGVLLNEELYRLIFHGLLHLTGYDDTDSKKMKLMRYKEDEILTLWKQYNFGKSNNSGAI